MITRKAILDLANPVSNNSAFGAIEECWKEQPQHRVWLVALAIFAGLASILGAGIATPLIFRTIVFNGVGAMRESENIDPRNSERFFPLESYASSGSSSESEKTGPPSDRTDSERFFP